jgi:Mce-associated membrane protein
MSESSVVRGRSRRRAVRSAGPPPDDTREIEEIEERDTGERIELSKAAAVDITMVKSAPVVANAPAESASDATDSVSEPARDIPEAADFVDTEAKRGVPRWLRMAAAAVAAAAVIALVVTSGFFIFGLRSADARDARRADYEQTAKQAILNLTTINDETAKADIDRVLAVASGELKAEYAERKDAYASVVEQAKVKATGEIVETAIENEDPNSARVLIAAKQTLTNAGMKDPQTRFYRFRVTVTRGDNGITASQVEFVA